MMDAATLPPYDAEINNGQLPGMIFNPCFATCFDRLKPRAARFPISPRWAIAAQQAIARATMASIFLDAFSFAILHPRGFSTGHS
jgi:hypothetical protein